MQENESTVLVANFRRVGKSNQRIANQVAVIIEADRDWHAYKINSSDLRWTVDRGNNWVLSFEGDQLILRYRYDHSELAPTLFAYLCKRLGWDKVEEKK